MNIAAFLVDPFCLQVYDYKSSREFVPGQTTDVFTCQDAPQWNKDSFSITGGYSPKNEAFINADRFIKMWNDVMGDEIEPYSKFLLSVDVLMGV